MDYLKKRESDPEYLKSVVAQREIIVEEEQRKNEQLRKELDQLRAKYDESIKQSKQKQDASNLRITNLTSAIKSMEEDIEVLRHEKSQVEFELNNTKLKLQEERRQSGNKIEKLKNDGEMMKSSLNSKIGNLQKNLSDLRQHYHIEEQTQEDKKKIIEDSNRDLRGFSNQKQERLIILQNQQYKNDIEYQSKHLMMELEKNEKLQVEIKELRNELSLHKEIEGDLVKRSSLAQTLIKKLSKELNSIKSVPAPQVNEGSVNVNEGSLNVNTDRLSSQQDSRISTMEEAMNKLKLDNASLKNYNHYLESMQNIQSRKFQTLGCLMADYLQHITAKQPKDTAPTDVALNLAALAGRGIREWKIEEVEAVFGCLFAQLKPFLSKQSLVHFPQMKNMNISFVEEGSKEPLSLPRIVEQYEKSYQKEVKKGRFKDIPLDISTKILRSNLRQWGSKIKYGNVGRALKSKSIVEQSDRSALG